MKVKEIIEENDYECFKKKGLLNYPDVVKITGNIHYVPAQKSKLQQTAGLRLALGLYPGERCTGTAHSQTLLSK